MGFTIGTPVATEAVTFARRGSGASDPAFGEAVLGLEPGETLPIETDEDLDEEGAAARFQRKVTARVKTIVRGRTDRTWSVRRTDEGFGITCTDYVAPRKRERNGNAPARKPKAVAKK